MDDRQSFSDDNPLTVPNGIPVLDEEHETNQAPQPFDRNEILIITGRSGAGRTHAANALEDLDWYVVDNIPPTLLPPLAGMLTPTGKGVHRLAAVLDGRGRQFFSDIDQVLADLRNTGVPYRVIFLDADDAELIRRFESSRRPHPLQGEGTITQALKRETELLKPLRDQADSIIDTTNMSVHDLSRQVRMLVEQETEIPVQITIESFGFKHGLPLDADHVLDVRFLKNPYWVGELRHLTGKDQPVSDYVLEQEGAKEIAETYSRLISSMIPRYKNELKPFVTVAIGCTGGRHRSVAMTELVAKNLRGAGHPVHVLHRDIGKK